MSDEELLKSRLASYDATIAKARSDERHSVVSGVVVGALVTLAAAFLISTVVKTTNEAIEAETEG